MKRLAGVCVAAALLTGCTADVRQAQPPSSPPPIASSPAAPSPAPPKTPVRLDPLTAPRLPNDAAALAAQLTQAERTIRSDADPAAVARAGVVQQAAYRTLVLRPDLSRATLAAVPADLRPVAQGHVETLVDLLRLTRPQRRLPSWRIVAPPAPDVLLGHYRAAQREFDVPWQYLAAIHLVETRMGRIRGTSSAGARGPMQFMPATWAAYGEGDIESPRDAIRAAARYLRASGAPRNMSRALYAYNDSDAYVRAITTHARQMQADPQVYRGYHAWQVYYRTTVGDRMLPVGYDGSA